MSGHCARVRRVPPCWLSSQHVWAPVPLAPSCKPRVRHPAASPVRILPGSNTAVPPGISTAVPPGISTAGLQVTSTAVPPGISTAAHRANSLPASPILT